MKCRKLLFWALLSFFVLISMSMVGLADEYREVQARDILKQIENGEDVNLTDCRIIGELNLSEIELETVPNPKYNELLESGTTGDEEYLESQGINKDLKVIESNIIFPIIFANDLEFSSCIFNKLSPFLSKLLFKSYFRTTILAILPLRTYWQFDDC